jgi:hypothetical protein
MKRVGLLSALAPDELHAILLVWNLGLRLRPGLNSTSLRSATTRPAGSL